MIIIIRTADFFTAWSINCCACSCTMDPAWANNTMMGSRLSRSSVLGRLDESTTRKLEAGMRTAGVSKQSMLDILDTRYSQTTPAQWIRDQTSAIQTPNGDIDKSTAIVIESLMYFHLLTPHFKSFLGIAIRSCSASPWTLEARLGANPAVARVGNAPSVGRDAP